MDLTRLSNILTKLYNTVGNRYITHNFISERFEFKVNVRYRNPYEYYKFYAEVSSIPDMPQKFKYRPEVREEKNTSVVYVDIETIELQFKNLIEYIDYDKKGLIGVNFMNIKK